MAGNEQRRSMRRVAENALFVAHANGDGVTVYQRRPYTHIIVKHDGLDGHGFAKISGHDSWDPNLGMAIAYKRAIRDISRQMVKTAEGA